MNQNNSNLKKINCLECINYIIDTVFNCKVYQRIPLHIGAGEECIYFKNIKGTKPINLSEKQCKRFLLDLNCIAKRLMDIACELVTYQNQAKIHSQLDRLKLEEIEKELQSLKTDTQKHISDLTNILSCINK